MTAIQQQPQTNSAGLGRTEFERAEERTAHNYHPLPVVVAHAEGAWMTDVDGRRFLDLLAGYSALNFGHGHPALLAAAHAQLDQLTLTSRAFVHDQFADFCAALGDLCGKELVLPMNTGAEAVETAIKVARKWGYEVKGVPADQARIIVAAGNFHGRTTTIVGFSDDPDARDGFGPFTPGFVTVPYGDLAALEAAIDAEHRRRAARADPGRGRRGDPAGRLPARRPRALHPRDVLFAADEIQSGLGRTGRTFACDHEGVVPDIYVLGKALGGGIVPVSAVVADRDVLGVLRARPARQHLRRQPAGLRRRPRRRRACSAPASSRTAPPSSAYCCASGSRPCSATASSAYGPAACGPASTSTRRRHRPRGLRGADGARRAGQGHPRLHDPARPAAGHLRRGPRWGLDQLEAVVSRA